MKALTTENIVPLPNILNLSISEDLRETFVQHLTAEPNLVLDASAVDTITTPCMQVIVAAGKSLEESGNALSILNSSPAFTAAIDDLGLTDLFDKWSTQ